MASIQLILYAEVSPVLSVLIENVLIYMICNMTSNERRWSLTAEDIDRCQHCCKRMMNSCIVILLLSLVHVERSWSLPKLLIWRKKWWKQLRNIKRNKVLFCDGSPLNLSNNLINSRVLLAFRRCCVSHGTKIKLFHSKGLFYMSYAFVKS